MDKHYLCFICYKFHPEMRGVSEQEFRDGKSVCEQPKCSRRGEPLKPAVFCVECDKMYREEERHTHS